MVLPAVAGGLDFLHIALLHQAVDLVGGIRRRDTHKGGKLVHRGTVQGHDTLHTEGLYRGQTGFPVLKAQKNLLIKMQFKFCVHLVKHLIQRNDRLLRAEEFPLQYINFAGKRQPPFTVQQRSALRCRPPDRSPWPDRCRSLPDPGGGSARTPSPAHPPGRPAA